MEEIETKEEQFQESGLCKGPGFLGNTACSKKRRAQVAGVRRRKGAVVGVRDGQSGKERGQ